MWGKWYASFFVREFTLFASKQMCFFVPFCTKVTGELQLLFLFSITPDPYIRSSSAGTSCCFAGVMGKCVRLLGTSSWFFSITCSLKSVCFKPMSVQDKKIATSEFIMVSGMQSPAVRNYLLLLLSTSATHTKCCPGNGSLNSSKNSIPK